MNLNDFNKVFSDIFSVKQLLLIKNIDTDKVIRELLTYNINSYLGCGTQAITFLGNDNYVYKCCYKDDSTIFNNNVSLLTMNNTMNDILLTMKNTCVSVLYPESILYENENWLIYKQKKCRKLEYLSYSILYKILTDLYNMYNNGYMFPDIYYINYGIINNTYKEEEKGEDKTEENKKEDSKIKIYDFHNFEKLNKSSKTGFLTLNVYLNIVITFNVKPNIRRIITEDVIKDNFGKSRLKDIYYNLIYEVYKNESYRTIKSYINKCLEDLEFNILKINKNIDIYNFRYKLNEIENKTYNKIKYIIGDTLIFLSTSETYFNTIIYLDDPLKYNIIIDNSNHTFFINNYKIELIKNLLILNHDDIIKPQLCISNTFNDKKFKYNLVLCDSKYYNSIKNNITCNIIWNLEKYNIMYTKILLIINNI